MTEVEEIVTEFEKRKERGRIDYAKLMAIDYGSAILQRVHEAEKGDVLIRGMTIVAISDFVPEERFNDVVAYRLVAQFSHAGQKYPTKDFADYARDYARIHAEDVLRGMWYMTQVDPFVSREWSRAISQDVWAQIRKASNYYISLKPHQLERVLEIVHTEADVNRAAQRIVSEIGEYKPKAIYFNLYYLYKITGDPRLGEVARAVSKIRR